MPQVDELRETQHHVDSKPDDRELKRALDHCVRAKYDAVAFDAHGAVKWLDLFKEDYRLILVEENPTITLALTSAERAQRTMAQAKIDHHFRDRYVKELEASCSQLREAQGLLNGMIPQLAAKVAAKKREEDDRAREAEDRARKERVDRFRWRVGTVIAIVAILSTTAGWVVKSYFDYKAAKLHSEEVKAAQVRQTPAPLPAPTKP